MFLLGEFLSLFTVNAANLISPGAGFAITVRNATVFSRKAGVMTGLGIVASSFIHKGYTFLGFGLIVSKTPWLFHGIKFLGSFYLMYLGFTCLHHSFQKKQEIDVTPKQPKTMTAKKAFRVGFFTDLLNPQASLCFIAIVAATVSPETPLKIQFLYFIALILTSLIWYTTVALVFSHNILKRQPTILYIWVDRIAGVMLIALGIKMSLLEISCL